MTSRLFSINKRISLASSSVKVSKRLIRIPNTRKATSCLARSGMSPLAMSPLWSAGAGRRVRHYKPPLAPATRKTTGTQRLAMLLTVLALALVAATSARAATPETCLHATNQTGLRTSAILDGLDIPVDLKRDLQARLVQFRSVRGYPGIDDLPLTPEQRTEINRRIAVQVAAMNTHPVGWPCAPFTNKPAVIRWMRAKLVDNGFRPAMQFYNTSPRQVTFTAIQDGVKMYGTVVRIGARRITVKLDTTRSTGFGQTISFTLPFNA